LIPLVAAGVQWLYLWYKAEKVDLFFYQALLDGQISQATEKVMLNTLTCRVKRVAERLGQRGQARSQSLIPYAILNFDENSSGNKEFWDRFNVLKNHLYAAINIHQEVRDMDQLIADWMERQSQDWGENATIYRQNLEMARLNMLSAFVGSQTLSLDRMRLTIIPMAVLSKMAHLRNLFLDFNNLKKIPTLPLPRLEVLKLSRNQIEQFPCLQNLTKLEELFLDHNQITTCPPSCFSACNALYLVSLEGNRLEEFPRSLREVKSLRHLSLEYNPIKRIESLDLSHLKELQSLYIDSTVFMAEPPPYQCRIQRRNVVKREEEPIEES
jgi:hypothetical protein